MKCSGCGAPISIDGKCQYCGILNFIPKQTPDNQSITVNINAKSSRSHASKRGLAYDDSDTRFIREDKTTALILCIFLGFLGVHQFYAGKIGMGVLYFFTGGLFYIGWIVDIILLAQGKFKDSNGRYFA